jgi:hypothetical protein
MCFSSAVFGQSGCVPFFFAEENTKFSAWLYAHSARQFMRTSARSDSSGTGFLLASVFTRGTTAPAKNA